MKRWKHWLPSLVLWTLLCWAAAPAASAAVAQGIGSFEIEQVYVNVPEMDVFVRAQDTTGAAYSPSMVRAAGVQLQLGDAVIDTGNIQMANEPKCYIFALDNHAGMDQTIFSRYMTSIRRIIRRKDERDQVMVYTLAGGTNCVVPATTDAQEALSALSRVRREAGDVDMAAAAYDIYDQIQTDFQSLAPRKVLLACTDSVSLVSNLPLMAGLLSGVTNDLNMALNILVAGNPTLLSSINKMSGGALIPCTADTIIEAMSGCISSLDQVLEFKTAIDSSLYGARLETLTISVPAMGSAVRATSTVYMGHQLTRPAAASIIAADRDRLLVQFNQPVTEATAALARNYRIQSEDVWGFRVRVRSVKLSEDGRSATLTTDPLYKGEYSLRLTDIAARLSAANISDGTAKQMFELERWPHDRSFYLARLRLPALVLVVVLLILAVRAFGRSRRERAAEHAAQVEHLLTGNESGDHLPRRWLTLFIQPPGAIAEQRWAGMVESSLMLGGDKEQSELSVRDDKLAAQHCVLSVEDGGVLVHTLQEEGADRTAPRVYVNEQRIVGEHRLQNDDVIRIGRTTIRVVL